MNDWLLRRAGEVGRDCPAGSPAEVPTRLPADTATEELHVLLSALLDGAELSETQRLHLSALLCDDPARQAEYFDHVMLDELLRWEGPDLMVGSPPALPTGSALPAQHGWSRLRRGAVAAGLALSTLLLVLLGPAVLAPEQTEIQAMPDLLDRLADWNLAISDLPDSAQRRAVFTARADAFTDELRHIELPADERRLAELLLETARVLASADSPLEVAEQLDSASERLHAWMRAHTDASVQRTQATERQYHRFVERNLGRLQSLVAAGTDDELSRQRLDRLSRRIARRAQERVAREAERAAAKAKRSFASFREQP